METLYQRVAGLDIHKKNIVVCLRKMGSDGSGQRATRGFRAKTPPERPGGLPRVLPHQADRDSAEQF